MRTPRATLIADTAIALLAERGTRGLTHRAVDERAGLPSGSTSNHARTRAALLQAALTRLAERETTGFTAPAPAPHPRAALRDTLTEGLYAALTTGRSVTLARLELALEATRRPELRAHYDSLGQTFIDLAANLLAATGAADPQRAARRLVAWCDGILFNATAGSGRANPPDRTELREQVSALLDALLGPRHS
ncbi:TetR/AcrR family transcriptional regulator [Streptantibioticus rubrisoli]|uniref:TetR family transcriptional regulator C-terminal domain-containing protein n=1 Tax=Streptantibioticus rubrisoli TaxID=1387313 RepID=A0ABT1PER2_9ACTN|nr:TetR/AcrR family transcriptional regulator [Streptantibioticus rubrisoli]MCQ4042718.1 TetR family transcriptional regulator C-terminal domain-containing protein [Streptantibioticus rubrisoli]